MNTPEISVIVPVYKAEAYLHRCVDSLLSQTYHNFELLLIDDGSPDHSGIICDDYSRQDSRIRVIHKPNGGVSSARQCGLDHALGKYVIHADPDDWVEPSMLEELYAQAKRENADMVICDFFVNSGNRQIYIEQKPSRMDCHTVQQELFQHLHGSCWNKLIRRSCYEQYHVHFPLDLSFCEDLYTNIALLKNDLTVSYLHRAFYHYDQNINPNSIVRTYSLADFEYIEMLASKFAELTKGEPCFTACQDHMSAMAVIRAFYGKFFNSITFRRKCKRYRQGMLRSRQPRWLKCLLNFSCLGFYSASYSFYRLIRHLYRLFR